MMLMFTQQKYYFVSQKILIRQTNEIFDRSVSCSIDVKRDSPVPSVISMQSEQREPPTFTGEWTQSTWCISQHYL